MAQTIPLWRSAEIGVHRFNHPVEHEDVRTAQGWRYAFGQASTALPATP